MDKELLDLLKAATAKFPGLRFCQLIDNALNCYYGPEIPRLSNFGIFYVRDEDLMEALKKYIKEEN